MTGFLRRHASLILIVILPTVVALFYYGVLASDVYVSESRFVVRSAQVSAAPEGLVGMLLGNTGLSHTQEDTYLVHDYMRSRDALQELERTLHFGSRYRRQDADPISRFPGIEWTGSFENLLRYYRRQVTVELDPTTSLSVLTVRAFRAEDAHDINGTLLDMAERLINTINERSRHDLIEAAEHEADAAERKARDASIALRDFRVAHAVYEPNKQAELELAGVARMQQELLEAKAQLVELTRLTPRNPRIEVLQARVQTLQQDIATSSAKVTAGGGSLAADAQEMNHLMVDLEFGDKLLATALASLESARSQALRQEIYLDRVVAPNLPDYALEPRRIHGVLSVLVVSLFAWGVIRLVLAAIREHGD